MKSPFKTKRKKRVIKACEHRNAIYSYGLIGCPDCGAAHAKVRNYLLALHPANIFLTK